MIHLFNKTFWVRMIGVVLLLSAIFYGVKMADMVINRFLISKGMLNKGATTITQKHFRQPEESVFNSENFTQFLENVTKHKKGILAWKPLYVIGLGVYLILACFVMFEVITDNNGASENETRD